MTHFNTKPHVASRLNLLCVLLVGTALIGGCGGLRKEKEPDYKQAELSNPLEVPPDLTAIPPNPSTSIPTASGEPVDNAQSPENKFKKWRDFEEFEKWKQKNGDEQTEFEAFRKFKKQNSGSESSLSYLPGNSGDYAIVEDGVSGVPLLRVQDSKEKAWPKIEQSIEQSGARIQSKSRRKGRFTVVPQKYWTNAGAGQKFAALFKKPKNRIEVSVTESDSHSIIKFIPIADTDKSDVTELIRSMRSALNTTDSDATS